MTSEKTSNRDESPGERLDRNLSELLQELRIALPGVQVLFAFLLAVPFAQGFMDVTRFQQSTYFATLILTAVTTVLLISPSAIHRATFRMQKKDRLIVLSNRLSMIGLATLGLAMTGAVTFVTDYLYGAIPTIITSVVTLLFFVLLWGILPMWTRNYPDDGPPESN